MASELWIHHSGDRKSFNCHDERFKQFSEAKRDSDDRKTGSGYMEGIETTESLVEETGEEILRA